MKVPTMNVNYAFSWTYDPTPGDTSDHVSLVVTNSVGTVVASQNMPKSYTSWTLSVPEGTGYTATLTAFNVDGVRCPSPPTQVFDSIATPAIAPPGNPILLPPVKV